MSEHAQSLLESEAEIDVAIEKLFVFQDKHLSKEKKALLVQEILNHNFPVQAVIKGISSLMAEEVSSLKLSLILSSIRKFIEPETFQSKCTDCHGGIVVMKDEEKIVFSLACKCFLGREKAHSMGLIAWNGEESQFSKNRVLVLA